MGYSGTLRGKNTQPELLVRKLVCALGHRRRYRLHVRHLPGRPDMVFAKPKKVILVHGCFWHWHSCQNSRLPSVRRRYWKAKFAGNCRRDRENLARLRRMGWNVLVIWECELANLEKTGKRVRRFLSP